MEIRILGPLEVLDEKGRVSLGGPKQRTVLAHLTLRANQLVSAERLIDEVWGEDPPEAAKSSLQSYVSHLRDALGSDRLEGRSGGYVLHAAPEEIDAFRFGTLLEEAKRVAAADPAAAVDAYDEALALWRGGAFEDLGSEPSLRPEVARLEELRMAAIEQRIAGELSLGGHAEVVPELETLIGRYPLRERLWGNLMVALYRSGRQGDALASYQRAREVLSEELGIDPSPELQRLQEQILRQDPSLELAAVPLRGYRLLDQVGEGAYGAVHRAFQPEVGREVAIKIIHPRLANHPEFIRRFATEAQLVARLEHPHIVPLYDYWREPDGAYLVMRYLRGGSLRQALAHGPLEAERAVTLVDQLALALGAAHRQGVVHRDVKPANILFDAEGNAYLSDFGIAKDLAAAEAATERGTPSRFAYYTSPEEARGEPPTHRADIYSLGLVLYELLTGRHPFAETPPEKLLESHMREPVPSVRAIRPEIPAILDEVIARATAKEPSERYPDVSTLAASFREAFLFPVGAIAEAEILEVRNPYKGLRAFLEADAPDFFGREALTEALVDSMRAETAGARFAAVVGPSGSGKSSVVRAGLIPAIRRGALPGSDGWFIVDMLPGAHPFEELEVSLLRIAVDPRPGLMEQLERTDDGLVHVAEEILPTDDSELVLVIDQFEEVFSLVDDENVRARFLGIILAAVTDPRSRIRVVVTLRGDFYDRPLLYREFGDLLSARTRAVTPLTVEELERAVSGPAEQAGLRVEPPLAAEIVSEVANQPGALPLLQYALTELFERRVDSTLTADAYHEVGGVAGALSRRAEALYDRLNRAGKEATRQLFLRLVTVGEGGIPDTRRVVPRAELLSLDVDREALEGVIDTFGARRLLSFDRDPDTRGPTVQVAHEALLREWSRLREWVEAAREDLRTGRQLAIASREWVEAGREPSFLVAGSRLEQFETWRATSGLSITPQEHEFLEASVAERERLRAEEMARLERERALERRSIRRLRAFVAVLTLAAIVASGLTVFAFNQRGRAQREASVATARELAAGAVANLEVDPERSILLAMEAVRTHRTTGVPVGKDAVEALHRAVQASRIVRTIRPGGGAQFSRDGKILATGGGGGFDILAGRPQRAVVLWDAETGERLRTMTGHTARIIDSEFSPDGSLLVGASVDDSVIVWDVATGRPRMTVKAAHDGLISASFGPRGDRVATSGVDGILRVWEVETGEELLSIDAGSGLLGNQFSPDGKLVASGTFGGNDRAQVWDAQTGEEVLTIPHDLSVTSVKFSPDGSRLATASFDGRARVWDLRTGRELATLEGHTGWLYHIDFSSDGSRVATGSADATARVWEARTGKQLLVLSGHRGSVGNVSFSPDGTRLATGSDDGTARIWDITPEGNREVVTIPGQIDFGTNVAYTPDATRLLAPDEEDTLGVWDASTGMLIRRFAFDKGVYDVAVDPGGDRLAVTSSRQESPRVTVADASSGQTLQVLEADTGPELLSATFSPDGTLLAAIAVGGGTAVWNVETGETLATFVHQDSTLAIHRVAFSPDGTYLATSGEGSIKLWEPASGREVSTISTEGILVFSARFAPDGRSLVGGLGDGTARIWDVDSGQEVLRLSGHTGSVWDAAFNPDGTLIATAGEDTTVRLWDPASGRETLKLTGHAFAVNELAFSPDGTRLATASGDGTVRVYLLGLDDLMDLARERVNRSLTEEECRRFLHLEHCPSTP